jgi:hypothetical protein
MSALPEITNINGNYVVGTFFLDGSNFYTITEERFNTLVAAKETLGLVLNIEEKYEFIISNFYDLEQALLNFSLKHMLYSGFNYQSAQDIRLTASRLLMNLLTSIHLYKETIAKLVVKCTGDEKLGDLIEKLFSQEYDSKVEYNFMCYMRNYIQHHDSLRINLSLSNKWDNSNKKQSFTYLELSLKTEDLKNDKGRQSKQIKEIIKSETTIDLIKFTKEYVQSISMIHEKVRELINTHINNARFEIESEHNKYIAEFAKQTLGLQTCYILRDKRKESCNLNLDWDDIRRELQSKNKTLRNLSKLTVVSKAIV